MEDLEKDVEKTLKIFQAMNGIGVARRCADLTQEIFDIAKTSFAPQPSKEAFQQKEGELLSTQPEIPSVWAQLGDFDYFPDDFFADVMNHNILNDFSPSGMVGMNVSPYENGSTLLDGDS